MSQGEQTQDAHDGSATAVRRAPTARGGATPIWKLVTRLSIAVCVVVGLLVAAAASQAALVHPFVSQITGTPTEAFTSELCGVNVDPGTGEVLVADEGAQTKGGVEDPTIDIFSSANAFVGQINKGVGSDWMFHEACSTAVNDSNKNIYVANRGAAGGELEDEKEAVFVYQLSGGKYKFEKKLKLEGENTPQKSFRSGVSGEEEAEGSLNVAVAQSSGDVYVSVALQGVIDRFNVAGEYLGQIVLPAENQPLEITTDANGDLYAVVQASENGEHPYLIEEFNPEGTLIKQVSGSSAGGFEILNGIAVDGAGHIYVSDGLHLVVDEFDQTGAFMGQITGVGDPGGSFAGPAGVATNAAGDVYVADRTQRLSEPTAGVVDEFGPATTGAGPFLEGEGASGVSSSGATLEATIDPSGVQTSYRFEYAPQGQAFANLGDVSLGAGETPQHVEGQLSNLQAATTYQYRVVVDVEGHGSETSAVKTFTTEPEGVLTGLPDSRGWELVSPPNKRGALIGGIGMYGTSQASADGSRITYNTTSPIETDVPANSGPSPLLSIVGANEWATRSIITPDTAQTTVGGIGTKGVEDMMFSTDLNNAIVDPFRGEPALSPLASEHTPYLRDLNDPECNIAEPACYLPLATSDEPIADVPSDLPFGGPEFGSNESIFGKVHPLGASPDLRHVVLNSLEPLKHGLEEKGLYEWNAEAPPAERLQLVSVLPNGNPAPAGEIGPGGLGMALNGKEDVRNAVSTNGSRVVWQTTGPHHLYLRDMVKGETIKLDEPEVGSKPGGLNPAFQTASADGSVVFFTDTQPLTPNATATPNKPDLYSCHIITNAEGKLACKLSDLTDSNVVKNPEETAFVQGLIPGASEDGSTVYFVADGVLTTKPNSNDEVAAPGDCGNTPPLGAKCNLYVDHYNSASETWEEPELVAALSIDDAPDWGGRATEHGESRLEGYEVVRLRGLTDRVSPNGEYLAFMSDRSLTGFDNVDASHSAGGAADEEVFLYHAGAGVACASCNRFGRRPHGVFDTGKIPETGAGQLVAERQEIWKGRWLAADIPGWQEWNGETAFYQSRYLLSNGRLFFNSWDSLVPNDVNSTADVYEYEENGRGTCSSASGCQALLSSGESQDESAFLDASESGGDAFFLTTQQLVTADTDQSYDVYDAHDCAESACLTSAVAPPPCNSSATCQAAPPGSAGISTSPATATVSGSGNVVQGPAPTTVVEGKKVVKPTRAQLLAKALKSCKKFKKHKPRAKCEKTARKRYGAKKAKAKSKKASRANVSSRRDR